jgi:hypothetical protein
VCGSGECYAQGLKDGDSCDNTCSNIKFVVYINCKYIHFFFFFCFFIIVIMKEIL